VKEYISVIYSRRLTVNTPGRASQKGKERAHFSIFVRCFPELKIMRHSDDVTGEKMKKARELSLLRRSAGCSLLIWDSSMLFNCEIVDRSALEQLSQLKLCVLLRRKTRCPCRVSSQFSSFSQFLLLVVAGTSWASLESAAFYRHR